MKNLKTYKETLEYIRKGICISTGTPYKMLFGDKK